MKRAFRASRRVLPWLVGLGLVAALVVSLDRRAFIEALTSANLILVIPAVTGLVMLPIVGATTWQMLTRLTLGLVIPWGAAVRIYYAAQAVGGFTPGNIGGDAYRLVAHRAAGHHWGDAALPIILQRLTSLAALMTLGVAGLFVLPAAASWMATILTGGLVIAIATGVPVVWFWSRRNGRSGLRSEVRLLPPLAVGWLGGLLSHGAAILLGCVLVAAITPIETTTWPTVAAAIAISRLAIALPFPPSGLGAVEGILVVTFTTLGLPAETALAASILGWLGLAGTTVLGAILLARHPALAVAGDRAGETR